MFISFFLNLYPSTYRIPSELICCYKLLIELDGYIIIVQLEHSEILTYLQILVDYILFSSLFR